MDVLCFTVCPHGTEETRVVLEAFLEALTVANAEFYRRYPAAPCCPHCARILYRPPTEAEKAQPGEAFQSAERLVVLGRGACGSIAAMVAGRERAKGRRARVVLQLQSDPKDPTRRDFHALVEKEDGTLVDPTANLERAVGCGCVDQGEP